MFMSDRDDLIHSNARVGMSKSPNETREASRLDTLALNGVAEANQVAQTKRWATSRWVHQPSAAPTAKIAPSRMQAPSGIPANSALVTLYREPAS